MRSKDRRLQPPQLQDILNYCKNTVEKRMQLLDNIVNAMLLVVVVLLLLMLLMWQSEPYLELSSSRSWGVERLLWTLYGWVTGPGKGSPAHGSSSQPAMSSSSPVTDVSGSARHRT